PDQQGHHQPLALRPWILETDEGRASGGDGRNRLFSDRLHSPDGLAGLDEPASVAGHRPARPLRSPETLPGAEGGPRVPTVTECDVPLLRRPGDSVLVRRPERRGALP